MLLIIIMSIFAVMLGVLIFKATMKLFSLSIRLVLSGLATMFIIVPTILGVLVF